MHSGSLTKFLFIACFSFPFIVETRLINGSDNNDINPTAGTPGQPFLRAISSLNFNQNFSPVTSPTDFLGLNPNGPTTIKCNDNVPAGLYPMPRCISNVICKYNTSPYNINVLSSYRSFRRTSHFATFFGQYISFDITSSRNTNPTNPMFLPADDPFYNLNPNSTKSPYQLSVPFLPANRSEGNNITNPVTRNPLFSGINHVTPFLDFNTIYGISDQDSINRLRDTSTNKGKLKTYIINGQEFPPKNSSDGSYIWGTIEHTFSIFTLAIQTIWIREHNRLCDELYQKHGSSWTDEQYFQEARRWVTAFYQKAVAEEYFGAILGRPLPAYRKYNPNLKPGVDTFFSTVTFRYGHSELSDFYRIQDDYGDTLYDLALNDIKNLTLLETLGLESVLWSMILQRQEEVDVFLADATKNFIHNNNNTYDVAAFDIISSRDRGIPLYNVVRQYFGFPKAQSFADISNKSIIQENLAKIYPNGIETVEAWVGVMSEDHLDGSNFGMVMNASMVTQYTYLRDSDKFWFEKPEMFTSDERIIIRNTTLRDIIIRNIKNSVNFPQNIWSVQPKMTLNSSEDSGYSTKIGSWSQYIVRYRIDLTYVYFKVQLQTSDGNGWFGMGFGQDDDGMKGAEFIIGIVTNGNVTLGNYHADVDGYHPPIRDDKQDPTLLPNFSMSDTKAVTVEFKRLLRPPGRKPISNDDMKYIMAYNPNSNAFSYHQNNRIMFRVNFYNNEISSAASTNLQRLYLISNFYLNRSVLEGLGLITMWGQTSVVSVNKELILIALLMATKFIEIVTLSGGNSLTIVGVFDRFLCIKYEPVAEKTIMHAHIKHKDYVKLPEFTWDEINERVQRGAYLVICDGLVVDIRNFYSVHPGGSQILLSVIGTDITKDFYKSHADKIVEDIDSSEALLIPKDITSKNDSSVLSKHMDRLRYKSIPRRKLCVAKFIDNINNEQLIGYEIQARGPFDACNRDRLIGALPTAKTSLLNPDSPDGCWDELCMIAGGTGITPMLQLIKYYLKQSKKQKKDNDKYVTHTRMHLLFGNRKIEDVIEGELLENIALSSRGHITVTYCLSEPPPDWGGLRGRINKPIIQEWMNLMQNKFLLTPIKSQSNIIHSHSILHGINIQSQSFSEMSEPQSPFIQSHYEKTLQISPSLRSRSESTLSLLIESKSSTTQLEQPDDDQKYEDSIDLSTKESRSLIIDPNLANARESYGLFQGKIIVSGPSGMLISVEHALFEMGFNEQNVIILH
ncbi:heme peroxidase [Gigaspora rosea]|uniref:Heme peroxidase n=1 Tax=Gigaspora rosea TaxID=44941 RepID=A0A397VCV9_9GLOM|nr:heme peroxidase [Gigaspora rosea]